MKTKKLISVLKKAEIVFSEPPEESKHNFYGICAYLYDTKTCKGWEGAQKILSIVPGYRASTLTYMFSGHGQHDIWGDEKIQYDRRDWCREAIKILESE